jgi:hypothetical protein
MPWRFLQFQPPACREHKNAPREVLLPRGLDLAYGPSEFLSLRVSVSFSLPLFSLQASDVSSVERFPLQGGYSTGPKAHFLPNCLHEQDH